MDGVSRLRMLDGFHVGSSAVGSCTPAVLMVYYCYGGLGVRLMRGLSRELYLRCMGGSSFQESFCYHAAIDHLSARLMTSDDYSIRREQNATI